MDTREYLLMEQLHSAMSQAKGGRYRMVLNHLAEAIRHAAALMEEEKK